MRALRIARLEFRRVARSRGLWLATALFAALLAAGAAIPALVLDDPTASVGTTLLFGPATDLVLPLIAILLTYAAVVGQRETGSIKLLLAMPQRRDDVLYGTILGRAAVLLVVVLGGAVLSSATIWGLYGPPPAAETAGFYAFTGMAALAYVAIGVAVSAASRTRVRSATILIAGFVLMRSLWEPICRGIHYLVVGELPGASPPQWLEVLVRLSPFEAYATAAHGILPESPRLEVVIDDEGVAADQGDLVGGALSTGDLLLSVAVLVGWALLAILIARRQFRRAELG